MFTVYLHVLACVLSCHLINENDDDDDDDDVLSCVLNEYVMLRYIMLYWIVMGLVGFMISCSPVNCNFVSSLIIVFYDTERNVVLLYSE